MPGVSNAVYVNSPTSSVSGEAPFVVSFNGGAEGNLNATEWNFGDGNIETFGAPTPYSAVTTHTYTAPGVYTPVLSGYFYSPAQTLTAGFGTVTVTAPSPPPQLPDVQLSSKTALTYEHTQDVAASTWVVPHKLGVYPIVDVFIDDNGTMKKIIPLSVEYTDAGTVTISFSSAQAGIAMVA